MEIIVLIVVALVAGIIIYSAALSAVKQSEQDAEALVLMRRRMSEDYQRQQRVNAASEAEQATVLRNRYAGANTTPTLDHRLTVYWHHVIPIIQDAMMTISICSPQ
jgi:type II secretory pathway pseudopilin PulG